MTYRVSVIVPVYRVEKYLSKCVESIVNQTYVNLEIILVDDGSPDRCPEICDEWGELDKRIKVVHKKNGGLASARNAGMNVMTGDLFLFVDSDDSIEEDTVQYLVDGLKQSDAELVTCGIRKVFLDSDRVETDLYVPGSYSQIDAIKQLLLWAGKVRSYAWGKLYRTDKVGDLRFCEELIYGEDTPFVYEAFTRVNRINQLPDIKYNYLQRADSLVGERYSHKKVLTIKAAQMVSERCKKDFPDLKDYADYHVAEACHYVLAGFIHSNAKKQYPEDYCFLRDVMKQYRMLLIVRLGSLKKGVIWGLIKYFPSIFRIKQQKD